MRYIKYFWMYLVLFFLSAACIVCVMATPTWDLSLGAFVVAILVSKGLAVLFAWLLALLYTKWDEQGYMDELNGFLNEISGTKKTNQQNNNKHF